MRRDSAGPDRRLSVLAGLAYALAALVLALGLTVAAGTASAAPRPSISIQGNHFVNGAGETVRLLGVNHPSFEYACEYGYAYDDGHMDFLDAAAVASWHADAVRIPLNEDCWLGINGRPSNEQGPEPPLTASGYRGAVEEYVQDLNEAGLYAILDLHWTAPGARTADGQRAMPDEHSISLWDSVASTFASNPGVVFDAFNEPYSPEEVNDPSRPVSWSCWQSGGCLVPDDSDQVENADDGQLYTAVGMQKLVETIRHTGAEQPILLGGLHYANDLSQWLTHEPVDPEHQLAASFHNYQGLGCETATCWNGEVAPAAEHVPVVTGEFDEDVCHPGTFDDEYMNWADEHGVSYLAWGWLVLSQQEIEDEGCSAYRLIADYAGSPAEPNGVKLHDHLQALAARGTPSTGGGSTSGSSTPAGSGGSGTSGAPVPKASESLLHGFSVQTASNGASVTLLVSFDQSGSAAIEGKTVEAFAVARKRHRRSHLSLGTTRFKASAGKAKAVALKPPVQVRKLLVRLHKLKVRFTITLSGQDGRRSVERRTVTLVLPTRHAGHRGK